MGRHTEYTKLADADDVEAHVVPYPLKKAAAVPQKKRRSCCALVCYILLGLVALFLLFVTMLGAGAYMWTRHQVVRFTVTEKLDLPIHEIPQAELNIVKDRAMLFADMIHAGQVPDEDLTVTVDEMNGLIAHSDFMRGNAFVTMDENDSIKMDMSFPARGLPGGKGRYFVASGDLHVSFDEEEDEKSSALVTTKFDTLHPVKNVDGPLFLAELLMYWQDVANQRFAHQLVVNLQSGQFMGKAAPQDFIDQKQNLVEDMYEDHHDHHGHHHHNHDHHGHHHHDHDHHDHHHHHYDDDDCDPAAFLDGIESVSFKDGAITIHARRDSNSNGSNMNAVAPTMTTTPVVGRAKTWTDHGTRKLQALSKWILF